MDQAAVYGKIFGRLIYIGIIMAIAKFFGVQCAILTVLIDLVFMLRTRWNM